MDPNYRADDKDWAALERGAVYTSFSCILELRARIEALEKGGVAIRLNPGVTIQGPAILRSRIEPEQQPDELPNGSWRQGLPEMADECPIMKPAAPADGLVERVADVIYRNGTGDGFREEARAAIREVAAHLRKNGLDVVADRLDQEANQ